MGPPPTCFRFRQPCPRKSIFSLHQCPDRKYSPNKGAPQSWHPTVYPLTLDIHKCSTDAHVARTPCDARSNIVLQNTGHQGYHRGVLTGPRPCLTLNKTHTTATTELYQPLPVRMLFLWSKRAFESILSAGATHSA